MLILVTSALDGLRVEGLGDVGPIVHGGGIQRMWVRPKRATVDAVARGSVATIEDFIGCVPPSSGRANATTVACEPSLFERWA
ncbi:MAG: hypothetical protein JNK05_12000 [Myxococcales bacterium]|nr:hypothetical protein [Myxococcales bacterium]